jgi:hypothetical protein
MSECACHLEEPPLSYTFEEVVLKAAPIRDKSRIHNVKIVRAGGKFVLITSTPPTRPATRSRQSPGHEAA